MDFVEEYAEMEKVPSKIAVTYSVFDLFRVQLKDSDTMKRGLYWPGAVDTKLSDEALVALKSFLKAKKSELKTCDTKINCGKLMWFFYQKLLELDAFDVQTRRDILGYMDMCEYILA